MVVSYEHANKPSVLVKGRELPDNSSKHLTSPGGRCPMELLSYHANLLRTLF
jgi:hypothetical protein